MFFFLNFFPFLISLIHLSCADEGRLDRVVLLFSFDRSTQFRMRVTMLRLGKLWVGGFVGVLSFFLFENGCQTEC